MFFSYGLSHFRLDPPFTLSVGNFGGVTFFLNAITSFKKFGQSTDRGLPVAQLRPAFGCLGDDSGGEVADPHPGISGIAMLTAWSRTTEKIKFQF